MKDANKIKYYDYVLADLNIIEKETLLFDLDLQTKKKIILLTGLNNSKKAEVYRKNNIDKFITKPVCHRDLGKFFSADLKHRKKQDKSFGKTKVYNTFDGRKILIVEDNIVNIKVAENMLRNFKVQCSSVENGVQALENLNENIYDLILMDIQMPVMDGYKTTEKIKAHKNEKIRDIPVVAMTAHASEDDRKKAFKAGMNDYITKPVKIEKLNKILTKWLQK